MVRGRYFFDPSSKQFHERCLHSELNQMKQRKRDRDQDQSMTLSEESVAQLPSTVGDGNATDE